MPDARPHAARRHLALRRRHGVSRLLAAVRPHLPGGRGRRRGARRSCGRRRPRVTSRTCCSARSTTSCSVGSTIRSPRSTRATSDADPGPALRRRVPRPPGRDRRAARDPPHQHQRGRSRRPCSAPRSPRSRPGSAHRSGSSTSGASAGLNLFCDRYRLDYGTAGATGPADAPVRIECAVLGGAPPIARDAARDRGADRTRPRSGRRARRRRDPVAARVRVAGHRSAAAHAPAPSRRRSRIRRGSSPATRSTASPTSCSGCPTA